MKTRLEQQGRNHFIAAPTGVAANNVSGVTLHALLSMPCYKNMDWMSMNSETQYSSTLRDRLIDLEFLLIDEVSMCGASFLQYINLQLQKIRGYSKHFGGVSVILISDNTQLAPVMDVALHKNIDSVSKFAAEGIKLYRLFKNVQILKENMRQK